MANNNSPSLDAGFEEVPLDEGFREAPVDKPIVPTMSEKGQRLLEQTKGGLQKVGEGVIDTSKGVANGMTLGGLSVLGGLEGAAQEVALGSKKAKDYSLDDLKKLYREYQQNVAGNIEQSKERSPILSTAGEFAGMMAPALATGGGSLGAQGLEALGSVGLKEAAAGGAGSLAKEVGKRALVGSVEGAPIGAAYGALSSEHNVIGASPEEVQRNLNDTLHGAVTGGGLGAGISIGSDLARVAGSKASNGLSKMISNKIEDTPVLRQLSKNIENEFNGQAYSGDVAEAQNLKKETSGIEDLTNDVFNAKNKLGKNIEETLNQADANGFIVKPDSNQLNAASDFSNMLEQNKNILGLKNKNEFMDRLADYSNGSLGASETNGLRRDLRNVLDQYRSATDTPGKEVYGNASQLYEALDSSLESVPGFREANDTFKQFLSAGPETIINKGLPEGISQTRLYQTNKPKEAIFKGINRIVGKVGDTGKSAEVAKRTFNETVENLQNFANENPEIIDKIGFDPNKFSSQIKNLGDEAAIRQRREGLFTPTAHGLGGLTSEVIGKGTFGATGAAAKAVGKATRSGPARLSRDIYNSSKDYLQSFANDLKQTPELSNQADALNTALEQGDMQKKNAILFSLMQNPRVRKMFTQEEK